MACSSKGDLGNECTLVKANPDGGQPLPILEGELPLTQSDYLSFGSPLCVDTCVRDADQQRTGDNSAPATGYCSIPCTNDGDCGGDYRCRDLLVDQEVLEAICANDPARCRSFSGTNPTYCALGGNP